MSDTATEPNGAAGDLHLAVRGNGVMNDVPLVLHICWLSDSPFPAIEALSRQLVDTPFVLLISNTWSLVSRHKDSRQFADLVQGYKAHKTAFPRHTVVFLANDISEKMLFDWQGLESVVFQHNGFLNSDEPFEPRTPKDFDAVYVARIEAYKRLELMADIESGCVVFADVDKTYFSEIESATKHLVFVNGTPLADFRQLTSREVAGWCARSRCGLCLSAEEGAMLASVEYLLAGIPVVSTRSIGGRDLYFDAEFCITCDDNAKAVATAVKEMIAREIDPEYVRSSTLARILESRVTLFRYLLERVSSRRGSFDRLTREFLDIRHPYSFLRFRTVQELLQVIRECGVRVAAF